MSTSILHMHTCKCMCIHTCVHANTYILTHSRVHTCTHKHARTHVWEKKKNFYIGISIHTYSLRHCVHSQHYPAGLDFIPILFLEHIILHMYALTVVFTIQSNCMLELILVASLNPTYTLEHICLCASSILFNTT